MRMIEKVARAIFSANTGTLHYEGHHPAFENEQEHWEILAKAALEAVREPTDAMMHIGSDTSIFGVPQNDTGALSGRIYEAMIDAALKSEA